MNKKERTISIPTLLLGLFFFVAYIAAIFTVSYFSRIYGLEASRDYAAIDGPVDANYRITAAWQTKDGALGRYSYIAFGGLLVLSVIAFLLLIKSTKDDKKKVARQSLVFLKYFFAMTIADLALSFNLGRLVSYGNWHHDFLEYIVFTMECLIIVDLAIIFFDRFSNKKRGYSVLFESVGRKENIYMWVAFISTVILAVFFTFSLLSGLFTFFFFGFMAVPAMFLLELYFFIVKAVGFSSRPKAEETAVVS